MILFYRSVLIIAATLLGSVLVVVLPKLNKKFFDLLLVFSGGFLLSFTLINILPGLLILNVNSNSMGIFVLIGFFFQILLNFFSGGADHGHTTECDHKNHMPNITLISLVISVCLHAFLDGLVLNVPTLFGHKHLHNSYGLLTGVLLHRIPEAFVLSNLLLNVTKSRRTYIFCLCCFALTSPLGLCIGEIIRVCVYRESIFAFIMAFVSGNFFHISTTILLESSPGHYLHSKKLVAGLLGALTVILF